MFLETRFKIFVVIPFDFQARLTQPDRISIQLDSGWISISDAADRCAYVVETNWVDPLSGLVISIFLSALSHCFVCISFGGFHSFICFWEIEMMVHDDDDLQWRSRI